MAPFSLLTVQLITAPRSFLHQYILTQYITVKLMLLRAQSHISLFDLVMDMQLDNASEQGTHVLLEYVV
jgi:hypothetical protein